MPEINEEGYETLRALVNIDLAAPSQWEFLELQEEDTTIVWRGSLAGEFTTAEADQTQSFSVTISGQDIIDYGTTLPAEIERAVLKDADDDGADELGADTFAAANIADEDDTITVTGNIEVPQV